MEPTSNPDNARPPRGLARFWPVHREGEDEGATPDTPPMSGTLSGETEMVALGSRRSIDNTEISVSEPPHLGQAPVSGAGLVGPGGPRPAFASGLSGPGGLSSDGPKPTGVPAPAAGRPRLDGPLDGQGPIGLGANGSLSGPSPTAMNGPADGQDTSGAFGRPSRDDAGGPLGGQGTSGSAGRQSASDAFAKRPGDGLLGNPGATGPAGIPLGGRGPNGSLTGPGGNEPLGGQGSLGGQGFGGGPEPIGTGGQSPAGKESRGGGPGPANRNDPLGGPNHAGGAGSTDPAGGSSPAGAKDSLSEQGPGEGFGGSSALGDPSGAEDPTGANKTVSSAGADAPTGGQRTVGPGGPAGSDGSTGGHRAAGVNRRDVPGGPPVGGAPVSGPPLSGSPFSGRPVSGPPSPVSGPPGQVGGLGGQVSGAPAGAGHGGVPDRDSDHSGATDGKGADVPSVESGRVNTWDRDIGGFGLGGRNGRFLFGGRNPIEPRPGLNGHAPGEVNGRSTGPDLSAVFGGAAHGEDADHAEAQDENGRDDMNGRAGIPGVPTSDAGPIAPVSGPGAGPDESTGRRAAPDDAGLRADLGDAGRRAATDEPGRRAADEIGRRAAAETSDATETGRRPGADETGDRRAAAGWASVPTSTHPIVGPTSAPPVSSAPVSASPVSGGPVFGAGFGQPPAYPSGLPDPSSGPVSGVPAPRSAASIPVPVAKPPSPRDDKPAAQLGITFGGERPAVDDTPRRSASLEDAEPVRRGRRAKPDELDDEAGHDDAPLRPGDVAAGNIAFWDEDATRHFRAAWHEVKAEFVDDPVTALTRAHDLLTDAVNELTEALLAERDELDPLRGTGTPDTESMRMAMRGYREFLDRILSL
jgi:hypothetical protein